MSIFLADTIFNFNTPVRVFRFSAPTTTGGRVSDPEIEDEFPDVVASVQPMKRQELEQLPEGMRQKGGVKAYTTFEMKTADTSESTIPDQFASEGVMYLVGVVEPWPTIAGYFKVLAVKTDNVVPA